jgi:hypothetical protein
VIDELILRGVPAAQAHAVSAQIQTQLAVLGERWADGGGSGVAPRDESSRRLPVVGTPAASPEALGAAVAGAVLQNVTGARP